MFSSFSVVVQTDKPK